MKSPLLSVSEAHARVIAAFSPLPAELVSVADAAGRVLAVAPQARLTQPPADLSAMDGYAVRVEDVPAVPATLTVVGEAAAGGSYDHALAPGEAVRIFTGGPLPMGADSIVIQEDTEAKGDKIVVLEAPTSGRHIRRAGLDFSVGDTPLAPGRTLTTRDVALAAAMNLPWLGVHRKPRIAILSTGDELVMPGEPVGRNQIVSSSGLAVAALVRAWGGDPTLFEIARDDDALIQDRIAAGAQHDMLITLGGASVGDHDLVQDALKAQGFTMDFWRIAMRPGKPLMFAAKDRARVLGLPGNPVSTMVCALLFLKPAMERMTGQVGDLPPTLKARLAVDLKANDQRQDYIRSLATRLHDGSLTVVPHRVQDSSMLSVLAWCNALLARPPHDPARKAGDLVDVIDLTTAANGF
ncbi:MAG: molybdopterin molybdotransferase MoeA [Enhydrobacter sp.]|nr:molybdopterin molybdotransferase MoeA [Enhydrobacter sp.]